MEGDFITNNEFGQVQVLCHEIYLLSQLFLSKRMGSYKLRGYQSWNLMDLILFFSSKFVKFVWVMFGRKIIGKGWCQGICDIFDLCYGILIVY